MKNAILLFATALLTIFVAPVVWAQTDLRLLGQYHLRPGQPTSADNIVFVFPDRSCGGRMPFVGNPYQVSMSQNHVVITQGLRGGNPIVPSGCPGALDFPPVEQAEIGRLPPGNYTISLVSTPPLSTSPPGIELANATFTVTDARATKAAPYLRLNYTGGWYDPNDPGWGLFISQDKNDRIVASWFTYTAGGKAEWYTFQPELPRWATGFQTITDNFYLVNREPGVSSPPPTRTSFATAGTANLNFTPLRTDGSDGYGYAFDSAVFTYTFTGGTPQVRTIRRFLQ